VTDEEQREYQGPTVDLERAYIEMRARAQSAEQERDQAKRTLAAMTATAADLTGRAQSAEARVVSLTEAAQAIEAAKMIPTGEVASLSYPAATGRYVRPFTLDDARSIARAALGEGIPEVCFACDTYPLHPHRRRAICPTCECENDTQPCPMHLDCPRCLGLRANLAGHTDPTPPTRCPTCDWSKRICEKHGSAHGCTDPWHTDPTGTDQ
jgi:hypothetical protein